MRTRARVDDNQPEIVSKYRQLGWSVAHTHELGGGFPDIVVAKHGFTALIEIKDGKKSLSRRQLTSDEKTFHLLWNGYIRIVESTDDVEDMDRELDSLINKPAWLNMD